MHEIPLQQQGRREAILTNRRRLAGAIALLALLPLLDSCGVTVNKVTPVTPTHAAVNTYFAINSELAERSGPGPGVSASHGYTFMIDHTANEFDQDDVAAYSGAATISRGPFTSGNGFIGASLDPFNGAVLQTPEAGNWALEMQGTMGFAYMSAPNATGLAGVASGANGEGDTSQNVIPFVSNASCPSFTGTQTYLYLTVPSNDGSPWNYQTAAAYGSVTIATSEAGQVVNFTTLQQFLLPGTATAPGTAVTANPGPASISGQCGASAAGNLISVVDTLPAVNGGPPQQTFAEVNLASGFLLEYNTNLTGAAGVSNVLGAGYGAVGLLKPSSQVSTATLVSGSFQGFVYEPGPTQNAPSGTIESSFSSTAAFGSESASSACAALSTSLGTLATAPSANAIYGGEYPGNDPIANQTSDCDMAVDLGTQDPSNNGLFTGATIYIGPSFPLNNSASSNNAATGKPYSFPAVAIAGQIAGGNAIFVLAQDTLVGRPIAMYLLQASH